MKGSQVLGLEVYATTPGYQLCLKPCPILTSTHLHSATLSRPIFPAHTLQPHNSPQPYPSCHVPLPGFPTHISPLHAPLPICFTHLETRSPVASHRSPAPKFPPPPAPRLYQSLTLNFTVTRP